MNFSTHKVHLWNGVLSMKMMTRGDKLALIGVTVGWLTVGAAVTWVIYSVYW